MSLFPAYSNEPNLKSDNNKPEWLENSSFQNVQVLEEPEEIPPKQPEKIPPKQPEKISDDTSDENTKRSNHDRKKKRKKHRNSPEVEEKDYKVDKKPEKILLTVLNTSRRSILKYHRNRYYLLGNERKRRNRYTKSERYYHKVRKMLSVDEKVETAVEEKQEPQINEEANISKKTSYYNLELGKNVFNIDMWLEYVRFQDTVWEFEKAYKKGSAAKGIRATAERKLAIIDRALTHNPGNVSLLRERLRICESVYPADELKTNLQKLVLKDPGNIILWQGYIEATQCSMAHCNTSSVVKLYNDCLTKLHQLRRTSPVDKSILEERILTILYQCGLFLRQAGLWEQLWTLLRLYLVLNLSQNDRSKFNMISGINDQHLLELEEVILDSKLPSHELWLRVERLRESSHWLPWIGDEPCEDPQRTVFVDDVSDLIHPITSTGNVFKLTVMILTLLKLPLLPFRHSTQQQLGLDYVPWGLDSIETLLPVYFPMPLVDTTKFNFLKNVFKLSVGPQYLRTHPGQEEYLNFLIDVVRKSGDCLEGDERTAIFLWWLRFERLLIVLDKNNKFKMPSGRLKKIKTNIKDFLKRPENRNNVLFYREYALIEYELRNVETACKILLTAISIQGDDNILLIDNEEDRRSLCNLYRSLIEIFLTENNRDKAIYYLIKIVCKDVKYDRVNGGVIQQALGKYQHAIDELLSSELKTLSISEHFIPEFSTDLIICHAMFLYLIKSPFESGILIEKSLSKLKELNSDLLRQEILLEWYIGMLHKTCTENLGQGLFKLFRETLNKALTQVPNNLYLLTIASMEQSISGYFTQAWWNLSNLLLNQGHAIPALFLVVMMNEMLSKREDIWNDNESDKVQAITTIKNRMLALFGKLISNGMCTRRCGLLWRLYLQFLYSYSDSENCRKVYYQAVEECPWLKALYIDAAIYIPAELSQIQDLIIEKELRIHVTPEELDILRT